MLKQYKNNNIEKPSLGKNKLFFSEKYQIKISYSDNKSSSVFNRSLDLLRKLDFFSSLGREDLFYDCV